LPRTAASGIVVDMSKRRSAVLATLVVLPSALFVGASFLKYSFGMPWLYERLGDFANPRTSVEDGIVTTLVLFGPIVAAVLALWPVVRVRLAHREGTIDAGVSLRLAWWNVAVGVFALGLLALLVGHLAADAIACAAGATHTC
jgi:hypothetical protein